MVIFLFKNVLNKITNIVSKTLILGAHEAIPCAVQGKVHNHATNGWRKVIQK